MFRRLAPCSRGVFYWNGKVATPYPRPRESESGGKDLQKPKCLKKTLTPAGFLLFGAVRPSLSPSSPLSDLYHCRFYLSGTKTKTDGGLLVVVGTCEKFEKGQYAFYLIELSRFRQRNKIRPGGTIIGSKAPIIGTQTPPNPKMFRGGGDNVPPLVASYAQIGWAK